MQLPIGLESFILEEALKDNINKDLKDLINKALKSKKYNNIAYRLNKALYSLKQASRQQ